jgi:hypothetical protein
MMKMAIQLIKDYLNSKTREFLRSEEIRVNNHDKVHPIIINLIPKEEVSKMNLASIILP